MAAFDKVNPSDEASAGARRKQILVGVLGALLLGVVGFHFLKGNPGHSLADGVPGIVSGAVAITDTPQTAIAKLEVDPAAHLLTSAPVLDPSLADIPHDPFRPSEKLTKLISKEPAIVLPKTEPVHQVAPVAVQVKTIPANALKIDGIMRMGKNLTAIINGSMVNAGMTVGDAYVVDIQQSAITVRHKDSPDGPTTTISLAPRMK